MLTYSDPLGEDKVYSEIGCIPWHAALLPTQPGSLPLQDTACCRSGSSILVSIYDHNDARALKQCKYQLDLAAMVFCLCGCLDLGVTRAFKCPHTEDLDQFGPLG